MLAHPDPCFIHGEFDTHAKSSVTPSSKRGKGVRHEEEANVRLSYSQQSSLRWKPSQLKEWEILSHFED
jgi:hypothetical protein